MKKKEREAKNPKQESEQEPPIIFTHSQEIQDEINKLKKPSD